jgi:hypothetical protein
VAATKHSATVNTIPFIFMFPPSAGHSSAESCIQQPPNKATWQLFDLMRRTDQHLVVDNVRVEL